MDASYRTITPVTWPTSWCLWATFLVLEETIGEKHPFSTIGSDITAEEYESKYGNMTTFYARDRGEDPADWSVFHSREEFLEEMAHSGCEYFYLMDGGIWYVSTGDEFQRLETALESIKENEDA